MPAANGHPSADALADYPVDDDCFDEAFEAAGRPRPHYEEAIAALGEADLSALSEQVRRAIDERGVRFRAGDHDEPFVVDPVPRIIDGAEWEALAAGLEQRTRALNAFTADAYGDRRIVAAGIVPERVLEGAEHYEDQMEGIDVRAHAGVVGLDVVRDAEGRFLVLEDNARTPSGMLYAEAALEAVDESLDGPEHARSSSFRWTMLSEVLYCASPEGVEEPFSVLLSDGPRNSAWWEHETIARRLGIPIVTLGDLEIRLGRLHACVEGRSRAVDVVYRRTDEDRLRDDEGRPTPIGEALLGPIREGRLGCVNNFGSGLGDDKLVHTYVEDIVRFYLDDEPLLPSVPTYDLADAEVRAECLDRLDELVVKPRVGHGGHGVVIGPHASQKQIERTRAGVERSPEDFIAQDTVMLSRHPTVCGGELAPRHVDLRPFVLSAGERVAAVPGGLTRVAFDEGSLMVNSSQSGGGKATWVTG